MDYFTFPFKIFCILQIEAGKEWMDSYMLTLQLSSALSGRLGDATSFFAVEIGSESHCNTTKVLDAIDEISISYIVDLNLQTVINQKSLNRYNHGKTFFFPRNQRFQFEPLLFSIPLLPENQMGNMDIGKSTFSGFI